MICFAATPLILNSDAPETKQRKRIKIDIENNQAREDSWFHKKREKNDNPDEKKVAKLTGDLYDLETELEAKAESTGVRNRHFYGHGPGMMGTYGQGRGGHMMGW